jgi:asparagine synthetase B (glutamine-hydrolysing)
VCPVHKTKQQKEASAAVTKVSMPARIVDRKTDELVAPAPTDAIYVCDCKCLLVGIGADEQMAGYGRHKTVFMNALKTVSKSSDGNDLDFTNEAVHALEQELSMDLERLWTQNLGRDDRYVSDGGR